MKSIHYTLQVPGGYTRTRTLALTRSHTRTHMETITKRRLKPFGKGRQENRTEPNRSRSLSAFQSSVRP